MGFIIEQGEMGDEEAEVAVEHYDWLLGRGEDYGDIPEGEKALALTGMRASARARKKAQSQQKEGKIAIQYWDCRREIEEYYDDVFEDEKALALAESRDAVKAGRKEESQQGE